MLFLHFSRPDSWISGKPQSVDTRRDFPIYAHLISQQRDEFTAGARNHIDLIQKTLYAWSTHLGLIHYINDAFQAKLLPTKIYYLNLTNLFFPNKFLMILSFGFFVRSSRCEKNVLTETFGLQS